ncbi:hypothetical protein A3J44_03705 [candidate division WOR-1 bacterium RIFCSPHIGHO2_02_FULL_45_12]|nr:MAG: hypothetical protein A3J44_03705 [candidate division WOR-1 bacterium RIFCSPHIGHO2_02_FULL_45_12]
MSRVKGFKAAGIACGLKKSGKPDLTIIYSEVPAVAAGVFTTNQVKAAPVLVDQEQLKNKTARAIVVNAGNANCWTGKQGLKDAHTMVKETARALNLKTREVLVASTGVIGRSMPMSTVTAGIKIAVKQLSAAGLAKAAQAILTTDTRSKQITLKVGDITITGFAKGAGMIEPGMATMLCFILTDAQIEKSLLQKILRQAVNKSFNMISVDNCQSTNDTVLALANGMSGVRVGNVGAGLACLPVGTVPVSQFQIALEKVCIYLAKEIARDGEGASKLLTVKVSRARNEADARKAVKALIGSFLLKAAVYGQDKNTGRILQAIGTTNAKVNWDKFKFDWQMGDKEDIITANLAAGKVAATGWGCDLTEGYVEINAEYTT